MFKVKNASIIYYKLTLLASFSQGTVNKSEKLVKIDGNR